VGLKPLQHLDVHLSSGLPQSNQRGIETLSASDVLGVIG